MPPISSHTKLCAVIGNPVEHSLSPQIHNAAFRAGGLDFVYLAFRVESVGAALEGMRALRGFRGLSVTIPHKATVMPHLDRIEPLAEHVGSVNTVTNEDGRLVGSTTDGPGTLRAFEEAGADLRGKRVLFIGSGGAVRAVAFAVAEDSGAAHMTILGRTPKRVGALAADLRSKAKADVREGSLKDDLAEAMARHDVVINGTPIGMHPAPDASPIPPGLLEPRHVLFDMVYRPRRTRLLQHAEKRGCVIIEGIEMLLNQAALQFERWTGESAPMDAMRQAALAAL